MVIQIKVYLIMNILIYNDKKIGKSLFNNGIINDLYIYPMIRTYDNNQLNIFIVDFIKRVKGNINTPIDLATSNQYDLGKNPNIDSYPNIDVNAIQRLISECKKEQSCKSIFDNVDSTKLNSLIYQDL